MNKHLQVRSAHRRHINTFFPVLYTNNMIINVPEELNDIPEFSVSQNLQVTGFFRQAEKHHAGAAQHIQNSNNRSWTARPISIEQTFGRMMTHNFEKINFI